MAEESVSERNLKMSHCGFEHGAGATGQGIRQPAEARQSEEMPSQGTPQRMQPCWARGWDPLLDFWPPELEDNKLMLLLSPCACSDLLQQ